MTGLFAEVYMDEDVSVLVGGLLRARSNRLGALANSGAGGTGCTRRFRRSEAKKVVAPIWGAAQLRSS